MEYEESRCLVLYHPNTDEVTASIQDIVGAYMEMFNQEAVLYSTIDAAACISDEICVSKTTKWSTTNTVAVVSLVFALVSTAGALVMCIFIVILSSQVRQLKKYAGFRTFN